MYRSLVLPHLEYIVASWCPYTKADKSILEAVQMRAVRMCSTLRGKTYEDRIKEAGMLSLEEKRKRNDLAIVYQILTGKLEVDLHTWFTLTAELQEEDKRNTRHSDGYLNIVNQRPNLDVRKYSFSCRVIQDWNSLPDTLKQARTTRSFKKQLGDWLDREENKVR